MPAEKQFLTIQNVKEVHNGKQMDDADDESAYFDYDGTGCRR